MIPIIQKSQAKKKGPVTQPTQGFLPHGNSCATHLFFVIVVLSAIASKLGDVPESYHHPKKMYMARGMQLAGSSSVLSTSRTHIH
jgi:hypothetical protein